MKELRIKDICDKGSSNLKQKDVEGKNGLYPVYGASGIISHIDTYHQDSSYIAIVKDGSGIGRVTFMPAKSSVIGTMQYILPKEGFNINYIGYCLQSLDLSKYKQGAAIPHIYFRDYGERIVKVTEDIKEQQSIVDYLDSAFAKIDTMKANAEKSLNEAKALFQASLKELLEPKEGWMEKKVKDLSLLITKGSSPKWQGNSYVNSEGILFVTSENVREGCLEFNPAKFVDNSFNIKQRRSILKKFDVLVNIVGASIGRAAIFDLDVENANINQAVCLIRLNWDKILPTYLCFFLNSDYAFKQYASMVKEAARANLSLENIGSLEIGIPSLSEQKTIVATLDSLNSKVDRLQENYDKISQECDALKQAILRQVFE